MRRRVVAVEAENGIVDRYGGSAAVFTDMKQSKLTKSGPRNMESLQVWSG